VSEGVSQLATAVGDTIAQRVRRSHVDRRNPVKSVSSVSTAQAVAVKRAETPLSVSDVPVIQKVSKKDKGKALPGKLKSQSTSSTAKGLKLQADGGSVPPPPPPLPSQMSQNSSNRTSAGDSGKSLFARLLSNLTRLDILEFIMYQYFDFALQLDWRAIFSQPWEIWNL
jgi:hypothetical protein